MRITGGRYRGRTLKVPPTARPTGARLREALFSIWGDRVSGADFLDLFAGSGSVGLDALSRGAAQVLFVERRGKGLDKLTTNCQTLEDGRWRVLTADLPAELGKLPGVGRWDLVFADPPYAFSAYEVLLEGVGPLLTDAGRLAVEHSSRERLPPSVGLLAAVDRREYGESALTFYRRRQR